METLPTELIYHICEYLDDCELSKMCLVSYEFNNICEHIISRRKTYSFQDLFTIKYKYQNLFERLMNYGTAYDIIPTEKYTKNFDKIQYFVLYDCDLKYIKFSNKIFTNIKTLSIKFEENIKCNIRNIVFTNLQHFKINLFYDYEEEFMLKDCSFPNLKKLEFIRKDECCHYCPGITIENCDFRSMYELSVIVNKCDFVSIDGCKMPSLKILDCDRSNIKMINMNIYKLDKLSAKTFESFQNLISVKKLVISYNFYKNIKISDHFLDVENICIFHFMSDYLENISINYLNKSINIDDEIIFCGIKNVTINHYGYDNKLIYIYL